MFLTALGSLAIAVGCSSAADELDFESGGYGEVDTSEPIDGAPLEDSAGPDGDEPEGEGDDGGAGGDPAGTGGENDDEAPPGVDDGTYAACPESWPEGWIVCEDFESLDDPRDVMLDYQDRDGSFVLIDGVGASGSRSMQATYREGEEDAGSMVLSFGRSPLDNGDRPTFAPDGSFQEIYWRMRVKTEPGWPDVGPGQLTRALSFASEDWAEAVVAHLRSDGDDVTMEGMPVTCVTGGEVSCVGYNDEAELKPLGPLVGDARVYSAEMSGRWVCVEGHLRLNTPGQADGAFEFWVDELHQAGREDLDLRGSWTDYGINAVVVENLWPGGAVGELQRWMDDLVVSTKRIGCKAEPGGASAG